MAFLDATPTAAAAPILEPSTGKVWQDPQEYERHVTERVDNQSRQIRSSRKYTIVENENELQSFEHLSLPDAARLLRECEQHIVNTLQPAAILCVEDEGLFVAREQSIPYYFQNMVDWIPPAAEEEPIEDDVELLRICVTPLDEQSSGEDIRATQGMPRFSVSKDALMSLHPNDRSSITDLINVVGSAQQRRVALERNRAKLHVLIEDGIRSIGLYSAFINALKVYDYLLSLQQSNAENGDSEQLKALQNYRQIILLSCLGNLRARRSAIYNITKILDNSRVWIEDLLERAVVAERHIHQTIIELLQGPFPLLHVCPPDISDWMLEAEQVAHTCASISYLITTKLELDPRKLQDRKNQGESAWLLGIPKFDAFVHESDEVDCAEDST